MKNGNLNVTQKAATHKHEVCHERHSRVLATISLSFDASLGEIFRTLVAGATLCLARREELLPGPGLIRLLRDQRITTTTLVTSVLAAMPLEEEVPDLHTLTVGGEALPADLAAHWGRGRRLLNAYGPTEATIGATVACDWEPDRIPPLGPPLPNVRAYVLDDGMQLLPVGVPGELYLGGRTLARGYLNRPDLTAEHFLPDPFSPEPGARFYRTGDRVRWLSDGQLEFLGRFDDQVKVRGYRIEPGEIAATLRQHTKVRKAAVLAYRDNLGEQRLIAYVVSAHNDEDQAKAADDLVADWQQASEGAADAVKDTETTDPRLNFSGWISSYTGQPIPIEEMRFWADSTVERIARFRPREVLEIGSGTGLILFRLAPHCRRYVGVDFAAGLLESTRRYLHLLDDTGCQVELRQRQADELDDWPDGSFDCVVLNSVVQYFPDLDYLLRVLNQAVRLVRTGGKVFLGDVRNLRLLKALHASVQLSKAAATMPTIRLAQQADRVCSLERELALDPRLFAQLLRSEPRLSHVQVLPKAGTVHNELTQFRYDVVLHVEGPPPLEPDSNWLTWKWDDAAAGIQALREILLQGPSQLGLRDVPNARTVTDAYLVTFLEGRPELRTVADLRQKLTHAEQGLEPETLTVLGQDLGYSVELSWMSCDAEGRYDVLFCREGEEAMVAFPAEEFTSRPWQEYANNPAQAAQDRGLSVELRDYLGKQLPEYMVPTAFVLLETLPLTAQGKLDRRAFPVPESAETLTDLSTDYMAPRTEVEKIITDVWANLLGLEGFGINDNFFELGGHSLLATQVIARLQSEAGVAIPIAAFFGAPTVAGLADWIEANRLNPKPDAGPPLVAAPASPDGRREAPQSFAQQRLWFLSQLAPGSPLYNTLGSMTLRGALDLDALERALAELVRRHESLRTTFGIRDDEPVQFVAPAMPVGLSVADLRNLPPVQLQTEMRRLRQAINTQPYDLAQGPLIRFKLVRMEEQRQMLLIGMHHIITDGWSIGILRRELNALYNVFRAGRPSPLPEPSLQYADFATWQRQWLSGEVLQKQLDYWKDKLDGVEHLELPIDRPRPAVPRYTSARQPFAVDAETAAKLYELSKKEEATLFMTLMAAFQHLLGRYSGQADVVVGSPIANRTRTELEGVIGFFVNTLVVRTDLSGDLSFRELLRRVRQTCLEAYAHQDLPFERLVEELAPQRDLSLQPLFQVLFVLNIPQAGDQPDRQRSGTASAGAPASGTTGVGGMIYYDLTLFVTENETDLTGALNFNTELFDSDTAERMVRHFQTLLTAVAQQPDQKLSAVAMLSEEEQKQLLIEWNGGGPSSPDRCIHHLVEEQVDRAPEHLAVIFEDRQLSYRELDRRANQVAHRLRALGVEPEVRVGLYMERGPEAIIGLLGILKAGGVYLPLDPGLPPKRLEWFLSDAVPAILLTQRALRSNLPECQAAVLCLDDPQDGLQHEADSRPAFDVRPGQMAYIIFTSGSTGRPKGVMVEHRSLSHTINAQIPLFGLTSDSRVLATISLSFDASVGEIFRALVAGATLCLARREALLPGRELIQLLKDQHITVTTLVTSVLAAMPPEAELPELCSLTVGGEALPADLAAHWGQGRRLLNAYGPTETTIGATVAYDWDPDRIPPLGPPLPNVRAYVLDAEMKLLPVGVPGELYLGGATLARGYLNRPELTAEYFLPDPFSQEPGARIYRTGDRVRWLPDGQLEFLGRFDDQVKVRGYRVEPGEIEAALCSHPGVRQAVVVVTAQQQLGAYIVPAKEQVPADSELREFTRQYMPNYMVPSLFKSLDTLPLNPSGKLNRRALPELEAPPEGSGFVAPQSHSEKVVAAVWAEVLRRERVGIHDNFFEIGGHSLLATQVIARLQSEAGVTMPIAAFFSAPTVAGLAAWIDANRLNPEFDAIPPLVAAPASPDGRRDAPQSFAQQRLWFLAQLAPGSTLYHSPGSMTLSGALDLDALERALAELVRRHESLRTTFGIRDDEPVQFVAPAMPVDLPAIDLRSLPAAERQAEIRQLRQTITSQPFDLAQGPLIRFQLLMLEEQRQVLLMVMHHIVTDGWSMAVLRRELNVLYEAFRAGRPSPLPEPSLQYADFATWQRQWLSEEVLQKQLDYWKDKLDGVEHLELPIDRPRPAVLRHASARQPFAVDAETAAKLYELSKKEEATLFMTLMAAFQHLLGRYSGQADVVVGSPIANRTRTELERVIGCFVNTLVVRTDLSGDLSFRELLRRVRQTCLEAYAHQDLPFERLVEELAPQRDLSLQPLFQVLFVMQNIPQAGDQPDRQRSGTASAGAPATGTADTGAQHFFDLTLTVNEIGASLAGVLYFNTELFDSDTAERMVRHFQTLLTAVAQQPDQKLSAVAMLSEEEQKQLLIEWNGGGPSSPDRCIHHLVEEQVDRAPEHLAVIFEDRQLSYRELDRRANQVAHRLRALGVEPEVRVGLYMERGPEAIIGLLGILKAGGVYLPLDPGLPPKRLEWFLSDAVPAILLTQRALRSNLPECQAAVLCLDDPQDGLQHEADSRPAFDVRPGQMAYIIFTSGSTGRPKGVMVEHRSLSHTINAQIPLFGLTPDSRVLATISLSFDASVGEIFRALVAGATLCLARREALLPGRELIQLLKDQHITVTTLVTSVLAAMPPEAELPELCSLTVGGEALPADLAAHWGQGRRLLNAYGPTETTIGATVAYDWDPDRIPPLGPPLPNVRAYVLDAEMKLLPVGVPGELYLGGATLARGYLNRPELTAEYFLPDPFSQEPGARIYRTGDRVRWLPDGQLEFLGRFDDQVKVRGYRVEPGEIEAALCSHPGVRQAVVVVTAQQQLGAYIVPAKEQVPADSELREFTRQYMPNYMVPSLFKSLDTLPLNPSGKLNRRALPELEAPPEGSGFVAPQSHSEKVVAAVWAEVLRRERVGIHDNFFEIGGHSLLATQVIARLQSEAGVTMPIVAFFSAPTVAGLAAWIDANRLNPEFDAIPPLVAAPASPDGRRDAPQSFAQQRLWFLAQLAPGSTLYHSPGSMTLSGALDLDALERALAELVRRHESLRTTFGIRDDEPVQFVAPAMPVDLPAIDLRSLSTGECQAEIRQLRQTITSQPFDLAQGPLIRFQLLMLEEQRQVLLMVMHHIVTDGWSMAVLRRELNVLYEAFRAGRPSPLPEPTIQYADFATWQRQWLSEEVLQKQLDYWKDKLDGVEHLELPIDRPRPAVLRHASARQPFAVDAETAAKLYELSKKEEATLFMTLMAAFQHLLGRYSGQADVVVGSPIANRTRTELERVIGCFVNTLVVRTDLSGDLSFRELLRRVRQTCLEAYAHQDLPFERLVEELAPQRDLSLQPLFQVLFVMQNIPQAGDQPDRQRSGTASAGAPATGTADTGAQHFFDLTLTVNEIGASLAGVLYFNTELFDSDTAERMVRHFQTLLTAVAQQPDQKLSAVAMLSEEEQKQLLIEWNGGGPSSPDRCIHHLVEEQVDRAPEHLAVIFEDRQLSYRELDRRANQVAHRLRALGVEPEVRVGLYMERGPEAIIGLLGILKAGGVYLPLDPGLPPKRLEWFLSDAVPAILLTQRALRSNLPECQAAVLCLDDPQDGLQHEADSRPAFDVRPGQMAYIIFTSGSTGRPKGVMVEHRSLSHTINAQIPLFGLTPDSRVLATISLSFDASVGEIFRALVAGATLCLARREALLPGRELIQLLKDQHITVTTLVTSVLAAMPPEAELPELCSLTVGGEALPADLAAHWGQGRRLLNAYGPTETTIGATVAYDWDPDRIPPLGPPLPNVRAYVLDVEMKLLPVGVPGELYLGGATLARGYLNRPELTAEYFLPDPFSQEPGARIYRTGDRVRWLPDGQLEFLGRFDDQVKVRGYRVEPGEIEAALCSHPGVRQAVVVVTAQQQLGAYIVPAKEQVPADSELREFTRQYMPNYMVPSLFKSLDTLPLNPSGKLNRRALPELEAPPEGSGFVAPQSHSEKVVAAVWAEVLRRERVGIHDNFFEIGGHSLLATQVIARLQSEAGVTMPIVAFFSAPTVAGLAAWIDANRLNPEFDAIPPLVAAPASPDGRRDAPQSFAQQRLWFLAQLAPGSTLYHSPGSMTLSGALDLDALERALAELVRRHESLRTTFGIRDDEPVQFVAPAMPVDLPAIDLRSLSTGECQAEIRQLRQTITSQPFDLAQGPLIRFQLLMLEEQRQVLLMVMHHIVTDGWSMAVLRRELNVLYEAFRAGRPSPLPEPTIQYADFATWQRQWLSEEVLQKQLDYWKDKLDGVEHLELPIDRPRPAVLRHASARQPFAVDAETAAKLYELSKKEEATLFMTLMAAFQHLLGRYSGQADVVVGSPIANRTRTELERVIGCFVNTLVVRTDLSGDLSFRELLRRVRQTCLEAYAHQDLPFERLVEELAPQRDLSLQPLFQVLFVMQNIPQAGDQPDRQRSGTASAGAPATGTADTGAQHFFDLTLTVNEIGASLAGVLYFNTELFDSDTAERMVRHFQTLLTAVAQQPDQKLSAVAMLSEEEQKQLLIEWNGGGPSSPDRCIHHLVEEQVDRAPEHLAVIFEDRQLSYRELDRRANQVAHRLRALGVEPEVRVGLYMERGPEAIIGLLGILKAGGVYLPLDPGLPPKRLEWFLSDAVPAILLTQRALRSNLPECQAAVLCLDDPQDGLQHEADSRPAFDVRPGQMAYIIFTSGSTGRPKGVMVEHRSLSHTINAQIPLFGLTPDSRVLATISLSFDASVGEIFRALVAGATLCLARREALLPGRELIQLLKDQHITVTTLVTSVLAAMPPEAELPELCSLTVGGEALPADLAAHWGQGRRLLNAYGPTETTIGATVAYDWDPDRIPPLGPPLPNVRAYVLDAEMKLLPVGVPGELYLGGATLARGYLNRPELTAEYFLPDPFSQEPGARIYRTGDRVRWLPDGQLEFLGRFDDQVKVRGYRVEPGEIEAALCSHPGVRQAVVVVTAQQQLGAYIVPAKEQVPADSELREFTRQYMPNYMVPSLFKSLDTLPLNPSGKLNRRALPELEAPPEGSGFVAPQSHSEKVVAAVWAEVLRRERVGIHDNFFEIGGHSLLATQVIARLQSEAGVTMPIVAFFSAPTVAGLAAWIDANRLNPEFDAIPPLVAAPASPDGRRDAPQSFAQQRLWFLAQLAPGSTLYHSPGSMTLSGALDLDALERALAELVRRHESLRTTFGIRDDEPVQFVAPAMPVDLPAIDLRSLSAAERQTEIKKLRQMATSQPFDLSHGPLIRFQLLMLEEQRQVLLMVMHHIVTDGWSMAVLRRELNVLYEAFRAGRPSPLPEPSLQYADFATWQRQWLSGEVLQKQLDYWKDKLDGVEHLELPTDRPRPAVPRYTSARQPFAVDAETAAKLYELSKKEEATLFMTLMAAFQHLLGRYSGQADVVVGSPIANRTRTELEQVIGFFVNTLVVRTDLSGDLSFRELLRRVRQTCLEAYAHQDLPFERLVEELAPQRDLSLQPLFQVLFVLQNIPQAGDQPDQQRSGTASVGTPAMAGLIYYDLTLVVSESGASLAGALYFNTELFDSDTAERMVRHFQTLLTAVAQQPDQKLSAVAMLSEEEQKQLLIEWNGGGPSSPDRCIHHLVEEQVDRAPEHLAVIFEDRQLSYRELDRRANQVAHRLRALGVEPEVRVGLYMERGPEAIIGLLGILKAGGVYLPLDPGLPPKRLEWFLSDAVPAILLTQRALRSNLPECQAAVLCLDDPQDGLQHEADSRPAFDVRPGQMAYIIFTSGSTGRPKGVMVEHRSLSHTITAQIPLFGLTVQQ